MLLPVPNNAPNNRACDATALWGTNPMWAGPKMAEAVTPPLRAVGECKRFAMRTSTSYRRHFAATEILLRQVAPIAARYLARADFGLGAGFGFSAGFTPSGSKPM